MTSEDEDWYSILGAHPSDSQAELKQKYQKLALLVQAHPVLWNKSYYRYGDQHLQDQAWKKICKALYPDWDGHTESQQKVIEEDLRKEWKSLQDCFLKEHRKVKRNKSSFSVIPIYDELLFLLPSRGLPLFKGNYQKSENLGESPGTHIQQLGEEEPTPSPSVEVKEEVEGNKEDQAGLARRDSTAILSARMFASALVAHPNPTARTAYSRRRGRKSLRATGRELESEALSFIRRVHGNDRFDLLGCEIASCCRRMRPEVRNNFISYVYAAAGAFESANPLPKVGFLISSLQSFAGLQDTPEVESTSSQTNPIGFSSPPPPTTDS
ncbi:dnaJ homolog subfamily C member 24 isoform X1 [Dendropsophus ebraccatus]|uniref:dnaJ homolog subfamily C member 24 isoform X1 n=1 Tax=Dendropsophus ebraccatus TaxID=150705 RepID=UPI00383131AA